MTVRSKKLAQAGIYQLKLQNRAVDELFERHAIVEEVRGRSRG